MIISELIKKLEEVKAKSGDIDIQMEYKDECNQDIHEDINIVYYDEDYKEGYVKSE
jgi:hypothetical protein